MSKKFKLTGALTYATVARVYNSGEEYTEEELGQLASNVTDDLIPFFTEIDYSDSVLGKRVTIGKKLKLKSAAGDNTNAQGEGGLGESDTDAPILEMASLEDSEEIVI
jgi:hypothetical protein